MHARLYIGVLAILIMAWSPRSFWSPSSASAAEPTRPVPRDPQYHAPLPQGQSVPLTDSFVDDEQQAVPVPPEAPHLQSPTQTSETTTSTQLDNQTNAISLDDALATSLANNPDLITIRGTVDVSAAAVGVAKAYPWNPFVQAQFLPTGHPFINGSPGNASGKFNYYVWAMQRFEIAHQRRHRKASAMAALNQVQWNIQQAELINISQTEQLYFTAVYQRQLRDIARDSETLATRLVDLMDRQFKAGLATPLQLSNIRIASRQARRQRELADATYQASLLALKQQLGMAPSARLEVKGSLTDYAWVSVSEAATSVCEEELSNPEYLAIELVEGRPDVLASRSGISVSRANLQLARASRIQDIQAGPIFETADDGTQFLGFRVQRDIGILNDGSALVRQRESEVQQQQLTYQQTKRRAANEAAAAIDRYERARTLVQGLQAESQLSPPPELEQAISQFEAGNAQIVDVVAVQNNLLQEARSILDLYNEVAQAAALLTQATAIPPDRLLAPFPSPYGESSR